MADKAKWLKEKSAKPPKGPKKKVQSESAEEDDDIPSAHSQPEDELVTDSKTMFSDGNPKKGGRRRERNTVAEMSDPELHLELKLPPKEITGCRRFAAIGRRSGSTMKMSETNIRSCLHSLHPGMTASQGAA